MAKKKKKKNRASGHHHKVARSRNAHRKTQRMIPLSTAMRMMHSKHKKANRRHNRRRNPLGKDIKLGRPSEIVTAAGGVLVGVAGAKFLVGMLPASISSNTLYSTLSAFAIAGVEWWLLSMVNEEFGAAAGLGGLAEAISIALTNFMPSVGGTLALSGYRGVGDFVPGKYAVPQNPILDAATGMPKSMASAVSAYPRAYAIH